MNNQSNHLEKNKANYIPLDPTVFLKQAATIYPNKVAIIHGARQYTYQNFYERSCKLAIAIKKHGIQKGDCVAIMAPNIPEMLEAHNGVPMAGAMLNSLNIRLDPKTIAYILQHANAKLVLCDSEFSTTIATALDMMDEQSSKPEIIVICDQEGPVPTMPSIFSDKINYETMLENVELNEDNILSDALSALEDEWQGVSLLYTSGTTGNPKGCVYHARGAYLNAMGNMVSLGLNYQSTYLWTLPMFHCDGWTFVWGVTAARATHVCLRNVNAQQVFKLIANHHVTHMCGAPIILNMLANATKEDIQHFSHHVLCATGGAAPPSAVIANMEEQGFEVLHLYGLTESYGPASICAFQPEWQKLPPKERNKKKARQGVGYITLESICVMDPNTMEPVPKDGKTIGEIMLRGNTIMKGYLNNPQENEKAFSKGWFHSGDLAVVYPDNYIEVKDRSKDIIISGGENISSIEIEDVLYQHPAVLEASVVAKNDQQWGEVPCAFITLREGKTTTLEELQLFCREHMASYKILRAVVFGPLPKTSTGKIQKFQLRKQANTTSSMIN